MLSDQAVTRDQARVWSGDVAVSWAGDPFDHDASPTI